MKLLHIAFILLIVVAVARAAPIGAKQTMNKAAFDELAKVAVPLILEQIHSVAIPDVHGKVSIGVGDVKYDLTDITLDNVDMSGLKIKIADGGLYVEIDGLKAHVHLKWHYKVSFISDSGSADVSIDDTEFSMDIGTTEAEGEPVVNVKSCSVSIKHISIDIHGGASWFYQILEDAFESTIKHAVESALHDQFVDIVDNQVNKILATLPTSVVFGEFLEVDFQQVSNPILSDTDDTLTTLHLAEFYSVKEKIENPGQPVALPTSFTTSMSQVFVSEWSMNSAGFAAFKAGMLHFIITNADVPAQSPFKLNTSSFDVILPSLYEKYPNMAMELEITPAVAPTVTLTKANGIEGVADFDIAVDVFDSNENGTLVEAFTFEAILDLSATVSFNKNNVTGNIKDVVLNMTLVDTKIGPLNLTLFQDMVQGLLRGPGMTILNKILNQGYPIPVLSGVSIVNPEVELFDGYLAVATDLAYNGDGGDMYAHQKKKNIT